MHEKNIGVALYNTPTRLFFCWSFHRFSPVHKIPSGSQAVEWGGGGGALHIPTWMCDYKVLRPILKEFSLGINLGNGPV